MTPTKSDDYEVGYGRPPQEHQFKKGSPSRNPRGRPRQPSLRNMDLSETINEAVTITIEGRRKRVSYPVALLQILKSKALKGDLKAAGMICDLLPDKAVGPCENCERLRQEKRTMLYKPEHHLLREAIAAYAEVSRQRPGKTPSTEN